VGAAGLVNLQRRSVKPARERKRGPVNYTMTAPCKECPFLKTSGFTFASLVEHASGEFGCHKACELIEDDDGFEVFQPKEETPHCAGALIFNELRNTPHQMMRICERLGFYDMRKLDMDANVGSKRADYRRERKRGFK